MRLQVSQFSVQGHNTQTLFAVWYKPSMHGQAGVPSTKTGVFTRWGFGMQAVHTPEVQVQPSGQEVEGYEIL
jgi:hypothetical protein